MALLRFVHIFSAIFWVGTTLFLVLFLEPTVRSLGPDGGKFMQRLLGGTRFQPGDCAVRVDHDHRRRASVLAADRLVAAGHVRVPPAANPGRAGRHRRRSGRRGGDGTGFRPTSGRGQTDGDTGRSSCAGATGRDAALAGQNPPGRCDQRRTDGDRGDRHDLVTAFRRPMQQSRPAAAPCRHLVRSTCRWRTVLTCGAGSATSLIIVTPARSIRTTFAGHRCCSQRATEPVARHP